MSYRLDAASGRYVLTSDTAARTTRVDQGFQFQRNFSGGQTPDLVRVSADGKFARDQQQTGYNQERIYVASRPAEPPRQVAPTREDVITNLKNELSNIKTEASRLVTKEDSGTRRIILMNNGRRVFDPDSADRMSVSSDLPVRESSNVVREPITNTFEARILTRQTATTPKPSTAVDRGSPLVREFTMPQQSYFRAPAQSFNQPSAGQSGYIMDIERKNKELEAQNRNLQEQIRVITNDGEVMMGDLNVLRNENAQFKVQMGFMRDLEGRFGQLRQEYDELFGDNTRLRNEVSLLKGELQHSTLLRSESNAILLLQEENSNLKSELAALANIRLQNETMFNEVNGLRHLQNDYNQLRGELQQLHTLHNENSALKSELSQASTQLSLLNNEVAMFRAKSGSVESDSKTYLEGLNAQLQRLQSDISGFEGMKRNLETKFGYPSLPVDDFCEKVYMMLADNIGMMEALALKDEQLEEFRVRMDQNQQAIEQLSSIRRSYEQNLKSINSIHESDRMKMLDLIRQHEEAKIVVKQQADELAKAEQRERQRVNISQDETVVRLLKNKDVEITKLQVELKNVNGKLERLEKELEQERLNHETKLSTDKNDLLQSTNMEITKLRNELQAATERVAMLEQELNIRQEHLEQLTNEYNATQEQLNSTTEQLNITSSDLNSLSELYSSKEKETLEAVSRAEQIEAECSSKIERYEGDLEMLRMKQDNIYQEGREQQQQLRRELDEVRSNWHTRLLKQLRTFDEALREQIEQLNILKTKITEKDDQIFQLKDVVFSNQSLNTALRAEVEIEKLKSISERKTQQVNYEVELQNVRNELASVQKALDSLGQKLKQAMDDTRKKDEFIQKYVMGKKPEEKFNIQLFFRQYEILVPQDGLKNKLVEEQRQIEKLQQLNRVLSKELLAARTA